MSQKVEIDQVISAGLCQIGTHTATLDSTGSFCWAYTPPWYFGGSISGYSIGGTQNRDAAAGSPTGGLSEIAKFSLTSDGNSSVIGSVTGYWGRVAATGHKSDVCGYVSGGQCRAGFRRPVLTLNKWPFASDTPTANGGDLTVAMCAASGSSSETHGYASGSAVTNANPSPVAVINKFPFASDTDNATCIGALAENIDRGACHSSPTHGYVSGANGIDKFSFSSDGSSTCVGALSSPVSFGIGISSFNDGYTVGGSPAITHIQKFPFSTDASATCVGDISATRSAYGASVSELSHGYHWGGTSVDGFAIEKFPYASVNTCVNVGCHTAAGMVCMVTGTHT